MKTATAVTKPCKKMYLYFSLERRSCVNLFRTPMGLKNNLLQAKHAPTAFNSKRRYEKLAIPVRVLQNTQMCRTLCYSQEL